MIKTEIVTITPEKAKELLRSNLSNRPASKDQAARYAKEMIEGRWKLNGASIIIGVGGVLLDGQHRLMAVVESGVPLETSMTTGLPREVFATIDTGRKRSGADTLAVKGEKNYACLAASALIVELYSTGRAGGRLSAPATNQDYLDWVAKYTALPSSVEFALAHSTKLVPPSILAAAHYIFSRIDLHAANGFIKRLTTGENISEDSVMSKLRTKLIDNYTSPKKHIRSWWLGIIIKAWNAERTGKSILRFRMTDSEYQEAEQFPTAV